MMLNSNFTTSKDDDLFFLKDVRIEDSPPSNEGKADKKPWKIIIIDDEKAVHNVSRMVLSDFSFNGRKLEILNGYSGSDARRLVADNPDTAVLLLDVVMETDNAGLEVVRFVRDKLKNSFIRIILRTGQPGQAPESQVIQQYDINDYREKSELTAQKFYTVIISALRSYSDLRKIQQLALSNHVLEALVNRRTEELTNFNIKLQSEVEERTRINDKLRKSEAQLAEAQRIAEIGNWEWNYLAGEMSWSDQIYRIFEQDRQKCKPSPEAFINVIDPNDQQMVQDTLDYSLEKHRPYNIEHRIIRPDGTTRFVCQTAEVFYHNETPVRIIGTLQDITERYKAAEEMRMLSLAITQTADAVMITDYNGIIIYINPAFEAMTGFSKHESLGQLPRFLKSGKLDNTFYQRMWKTILKGEVFTDVLINRRKDGSYYYEEKTITPQKNNKGDITHFISTGKDITERMEAQERLKYLAHYDSLTGLPNRVLLQDRLAQALTRARWRGRSIGIMFLDMDRFKVINDTLGHDYGDHVLKEASERLNNSVREGDTVARLGGDEFAIILNDIASEHDVPPMASKILSFLAQPFEVRNHEVFLTTSIGISLCPVDGKDTRTLLKKADVAMYHAKELGGNNFQFYTQEHDTRAMERLTLETSLRRALEREEFLLHYQPQLELKIGKIIRL